MNRCVAIIVALTANLMGTFSAPAQVGMAAASTSSIIPVVSKSTANKPNIPIPNDIIASNYRARVAKVTQQPTMLARAAPEEFNRGIYDWLLEHPDRASLAWQRLGIPCAEIVDRGNGRYGWTDGEGTEVVWRTVGCDAHYHIWYAEGQAKLGPMLPPISVKAVAVLQHTIRTDADGRSSVSQAAEIYLLTDSKAAALVARLIGPAAPRLADQGARQLLIFFSGLTRYFEEHPQDIEALLSPRK